MNHVIADVPVYLYILGVLGLSFVFTLCAIKVAYRTDFVYRPVAYRWNTRTVALGGGTAILLSIVVGVLATQSTVMFSILPPLLVVFGLGLYDDIKGVGPWTKLTFELIATAWLFYYGFHFNFGPLYLMLPLSAVWFLGITNAQNIIDNMDGIAAGSAGISAMGFALLFALTGGPIDLQVFASVTAAACLGFLFLNFNPAKIFMGDAGSLPLGFILGLLATAFTQADHGSLTWKIFALINVLIIPLFDTFLVSFSRKTTGRMIMAGGKDHTTHRLVKSGLTEKQTALVIYGIAMMGAFLALFTFHLTSDWLLVVMAIWSIAVLWFARFLWAVPTYQQEVVRGKPVSQDMPQWVDSLAERAIQLAGAVGVFVIGRELIVDLPWENKLGVIYGSALTVALTTLLVTGVHAMKKRLKSFRIRFQIPNVVSKSLEVGN